MVTDDDAVEVLLALGDGQLVVVHDGLFTLKLLYLGLAFVNILV